MMTSDQQAILKRLRIKAEILKMDLKSRSDQRHQQVSEILMLIELLEKM